jgi:hypothetical protein
MDNNLFDAKFGSRWKCLIGEFYRHYNCKDYLGALDIVKRALWAAEVEGAGGEKYHDMMRITLVELFCLYRTMGLSHFSAQVAEKLREFGIRGL